MSPALSSPLSLTNVLQAWPKAPPTIFTKFNTSVGIKFRRSSPPFDVRRNCCCRALSPGQPPPPPNGKDSGPASTIAMLQEKAKIFLAVLFWMALFFWYSAWDRSNDSGGRPKKGSWFRK